MKLWPLNNEFDIEIVYPYTFNFPSLVVIKDGKIILDDQIFDKPISYYMNHLKEMYPESEFLKNLFKKTGR